MAIHNDDAMNTTAAPVAPKTSAQPNAIVRFLREVLAELKKTNWPSRNELTKATVVVMLTIVFVAIYLFASDQIAALLMKYVGITTGLPQ